VPQGKFEERITVLHAPIRDFKIDWLLQLLLPLVEVAKDIGNITVHAEEKGNTPYYVRASGVELVISRSTK
jgi:hypothetical protein